MRHSCRQQGCAVGVAYAGGKCHQHQPVRTGLQRRATVWTRFSREPTLLQQTWIHQIWQVTADTPGVALYHQPPVGMVELGARVYAEL